jgi:hypothetical protein
MVMIRLLALKKSLVANHEVVVLAVGNLVTLAEQGADLVLHIHNGVRRLCLHED